MKITGNDHTTRGQTNLLQDGIGRHFGISRRELGAGPVRNPTLAKRYDDLFRHFFASECCLKGELQIALRRGRKGIGNAVQ